VLPRQFNPLGLEIGQLGEHFLEVQLLLLQILVDLQVVLDALDEA